MNTLCKEQKPWNGKASSIALGKITCSLPTGTHQRENSEAKKIVIHCAINMDKSNSLVSHKSETKHGFSLIILENLWKSSEYLNLGMHLTIDYHLLQISCPQAYRMVMSYVLNSHVAYLYQIHIYTGTNGPFTD